MAWPPAPAGASGSDRRSYPASAGSMSIRWQRSRTHRCSWNRAQGLQRGFFGWFEEDHPAATSTADLVFVDQALALPESGACRPVQWRGQVPAASLFSAPLAGYPRPVRRPRSSHLFGTTSAQVEREDGRTLSFFTGDRSHVVSQSQGAESPPAPWPYPAHRRALTPDEAALTSTAWMAGVFNSMVTQGHVSINRFLSTTHSYLGLFRAHGQRLFAELEGGWHCSMCPRPTR